MAKKQFLLTENCEFFGTWWIPSTPDIKIAGVLKFNANERIELSLEASFEEEEYDVIHGFASGSLITLFRSFPITHNSFGAYSNYNPCKIISNLALIGVNYTEGQFKTVSHYKFDFGRLRGWVEKSGFTANFEGSKYTLSYERPSPINFLDNDDVSVNLISYAEGISAPLRESATISEVFIFEVTSKSPDANFDYLVYGDGIRKFLTLASRCNIDYKSIRFIDGDNEGFILSAYPKIKIQYPSKNLSRLNSFFTLSHTKLRLPDFFHNWIKIYDLATEPCNLYFYGYECMTYLKFTAITQALEEFYRDALAKTSKEKEFGFANIIKRIYNRYPLITSKFNSDEETFSTMVTDHRNHFTHWSGNKKDSVLEGLEFDFLRRDINLLLEMCLLEQCGFTIDQVQEIVEKCFHYENYMNQRSKIAFKTV